MVNSSKKYNQYRKVIKRAYSKSPLQTFTYNTNAATVYPNFNFANALQMVQEDPITSGAIQHFVDKCSEGDFSIINRKDFSYNRDEEIKLDEKYLFRRDVLTKVYRAGKIYKNVFMEIVRDTNGHCKALNIMDSQNIQPVTSPNGDPIKFISSIPDPTTGTYPEWKADDIVWFKFGDITKGYAPVDLRSLWETLLAKEYVKRYISWLWKTGQYRIVYNPKQGSDKDITDFLVYAKRHDDNFQVPFIFKGELDIKMLRNMEEVTKQIELLQYYDSQILVALRVPPNDAGIPDSSGRSNADAQANNLTTSVTAFKKIIEDTINFDLFPKINKSNLLLRFSPIDRFSEKQVFETIQIMKAINMTDEVVQEYLQDKGMFFAAKLFMEPEMQSAVPNSKEKDNYVSRQRSTDAGTGNKQQDEVTTRDDQINGGQN